MTTNIDNNNTNTYTIQLSRGFQTTPSTEQMSEGELFGKSAIAGTLGMIPFLINQLAMYTFKGLAYIAGSAQKAESGGHPLGQLASRGVRVLTGIPGMIAAVAMIGSARLFALSQTLAWKHYVKNPSGDGLNTRIGWYGARPWLFNQDLKSIAKAFYAPGKLKRHATNPEWSLLEWSRVKV